MTKARTSLEARLSLLMIGILFVVLFGIGGFAIQSQNRAIVEHTERGFDLVTRALSVGAPSAARGEVTADVDRLIKNSESGLKYVLVTDQNGQALFSSSRTPVEILSSPSRIAKSHIESANGIDPGRIYSSTHPVAISKTRDGIFTAAWDTSGMHDEIISATAKTLLIVSLGFIAGIILSLTFARSITNAIRPLTDCARSVAAGNLTCKAPGSPRGEIGELTQAFNYMVEVLHGNQEQLIERANTDVLTGLYNHRYFQERLQDEVNRAARYGGKVALLMIDIDYFKTFNDDHGHPTGDAALHGLAQVLMQSIRDTDIPVRYGGEEFAVILPETGMREASQTAERIRKSVEECHFADPEHQKLSLTVSIGASEFPTHASDRTGLISTADIALYQAKAKGRNRTETYSADCPAMPKPDPQKLYVLLHTDDMATIEALAEAIDAKLKLSAGHSHQVARHAMAIGKKMGLSEAERAGIQLAALLRDVGQIAVPDAVLSKSAALSTEEMAEVATHPMLGHAIIQKAPHLSSVLPAILHHHEHYNGTGYPSHIAADQIPLAARIIAVADAYQSMLISRPHRKYLTPGEAQMELASKSGSQFDPKVVDAFLEVLAEETGYRQAA